MFMDRYDPLNLFERIPSLGMQMDPVLAQRDRLLDHDEMFQAVKADLSKRYPQTLTVGRHSTPVEGILRMLVITHLYGWSFEDTEHVVAASLVLRQTCRIYAEHVPDDTTLIRWATLIQPATVQTVPDHVTVLARQLKVTNGRKLRIDGTVVETNIHHPSDSTLLNDGVRVLSRVMRTARQVAADAVGWSQAGLAVGPDGHPAASGCCGRGGVEPGAPGGSGQTGQGWDEAHHGRGTPERRAGCRCAEDGVAARGRPDPNRR